MRIKLNSSEIVDDLIAALCDSECIAARLGEDTVEVGFPSQVFDTAGDADEHAVTELVFFLRAWLVRYPGAEATLYA